MNNTARTFRLLDGTLCNPQRRFKKQFPSLISILSRVSDGRKDQGKRHELENILAMILIGFVSGCKNIQECWEWSLESKNHKFLRKEFDSIDKIPHPTTISRALSVCNVEDLIEITGIWRRRVYGVVTDLAVSMDGKTLRGIHNRKGRHLLSLVSHQTHEILGQIGVTNKENEITASHRLLNQSEADLYGVVITADALLTQKKVINRILRKRANYLLTVKRNNRDLHQAIRFGFQDKVLKYQSHTETEFTHGREITRSVKISQDYDMDLIREEWQGVAWVGQVTREGKRRVEKQGTGETKLKSFYEKTYFICSKKDLTAEEAYQLIRGHWVIENNLHWQKDWTYLEDRQTLRRGKSPQVVSFLRGLVIELLYRNGFKEISKATRKFARNIQEHKKFLNLAHIF